MALRPDPPPSGSSPAAPGGPGPEGRKPRGPFRRLGPAELGALFVVVVLVAVVLAVRPSTSAGEEDLSSAREAARERLGGGDPGLALTAEGLGPVALGDDLDAVGAAGLVRRGTAGGCEYYTTSPWLSGTRLGAWVREGEAVAVFAAGVDLTLTPVSVRGLPGDAAVLGDLLSLPATRTEQVPVPWQEQALEVPVARFALDGRELTVASLDGPGAGYAELAGSTDRCELTAGTLGTLPAASPASFPELRWDGWQELSIGMTEAEARRRVAFTDPRSDAPANRRCRLLLPVDEGTGLAHVSVREGRVSGITIDAGATEDGLAVGSAAEDVRATYPELTTSHVEFRWGQGLAVDWAFDEGRLSIVGGSIEVAVPGLSVPVQSPPGRVSAVGAGQTC